VADTIWSVIGVVGGAAAIFVLAHYAGAGHADRDAEDAAREYFDEHGRWPDDDPA
jgi:uncharacterized membrane protein YdjX (TVP38/TMEM64 family)